MVGMSETAADNILIFLWGGVESGLALNGVDGRASRSWIHGLGRLSRGIVWTGWIIEVNPLVLTSFRYFKQTDSDSNIQSFDTRFLWITSQ